MSNFWTLSDIWHPSIFWNLSDIWNLSNLNIVCLLHLVGLLLLNLSYLSNSLSLDINILCLLDMCDRVHCVGYSQQGIHNISHDTVLVLRRHSNLADRTQQAGVTVNAWNCMSWNTVRVAMHCFFILIE